MSENDGFEIEAGARAQIIEKELRDGDARGLNLAELLRFHQVDGGIVAQKTEARFNARALEILIQKGSVFLHVVDKWVEAGQPPPDGALFPPATNIEGASFTIEEVMEVTEEERKREIPLRIKPHDVYAIPVVCLSPTL